MSRRKVGATARSKNQRPSSPRPSTRRATQAEQERQLAQRRKDRRTLIIAAAVVLLLVIGGGVGFQVWRANRAPSAAPEVTATPTPQPVADGTPIRLGDAEAPRTLTAYVDFHCPGCGGFEDDYGAVLFDAVGRGAVAIEVYPMSFHDAGSTAAVNGFGCAAEAGFAQSYYRGLFANRDLDWSAAQLTALAAKVTTDVPPTFSSCVESGARSGWADSINAAADSAGVQQTPTVLLDGDPVDLSATTPEMPVAMIDEAPAR